MEHPPSCGCDSGPATPGAPRFAPIARSPKPYSISRNRQPIRRASRRAATSGVVSPSLTARMTQLRRSGVSVIGAVRSSGWGPFPLPRRSRYSGQPYPQRPLCTCPPRSVSNFSASSGSPIARACSVTTRATQSGPLPWNRFSPVNIANSSWCAAIVQAASLPPAATAANNGSKTCAARWRTTGTATPSPERWYASL